MKKLACLVGAVQSVPAPPKEDTAVFYMPLYPEGTLGAYVAKLKIGDQDAILAPSTRIDTIALTGTLCKSASKCNTPNVYNRGLSHTSKVVQEDDDQQTFKAPYNHELVFLFLSRAIDGDLMEDQF